MDTPKHWTEMGLSEDDLFTPAALPYWQQFPVSDFLLTVVNEAGHKTVTIKSFMDLLFTSPEFKAIKFNDELTGVSIYEAIVKRLEVIDEVLVFMGQYARALESE